MNEVFSCIKNRRSTRLYKNEKISKENIIKIVDAARWAPSGKNIQPWQFVCLMDDEVLKGNIVELSVHKNWLKTAPCLIIVFLDKQQSYDFVKDVQAIGAAIQNLLLSAHELGIGTCWVADILKNDMEIKTLLNVPDYYSLMAVIAVGYARGRNLTGIGRKEIESILDWR